MPEALIIGNIIRRNLTYNLLINRYKSAIEQDHIGPDTISQSFRSYVLRHQLSSKPQRLLEYGASTALGATPRTGIFPKVNA